MSWHTTALLIRGDYSKDYPKLLANLGLEVEETGSSVSLDDASSSSNDGVAIGFVEGWTVLWGNLAMLLIDDDAVTSLTKKSNAIRIVLEGTSGTAGFAMWNKGKVVRDWMSQEGEIIKNEGAPLPEEKRAFAKRDPEQGVLQLLIALTVPYKTLESIDYQQFDMT